MTAFYVAIVLMVMTIAAVTCSAAERYACEHICAQDWRICRWAHFAIERIYYLRNINGDTLYVGQTVNPERRWAQHAADGRRRYKAKSDWAITLHLPLCTVVRYCWTHKQVMRIERRRTLALWAAFAVYEWLLAPEYSPQLFNVSNTPRDTTRPPKVREWAVALLFLPFYFVEGWLIPEAQWATPVRQESLA